MRRRVLVAAAIALLAATGGCGSGGARTTARPPVIERPVLLQVAQKAQKEMRTKLHDKAITVRGMTCRPASAVAYACGLRVTDGRRRPATVVIALKYDPRTKLGTMGFAAASNRHWARVLTRR
jgi:hypothetical protein